MKGLLLKDFYMVMKYCRAYFLIAAVFIAVSFASDNNLFFISYPCLLSGMIPTTLLAYDERSRWNAYSGTLPYTRAQIVSGKYLAGLFAQIFILLLSGIAQAVRMNISGTFDPKDYLVLMTLLLVMSCVASSLTLPFMFKWGVEKGRIAYYAAILFVCVGGTSAQTLLNVHMQTEITLDRILLVFVLGGALLYALSWQMSIAFYKKREIK